MQILLLIEFGGRGELFACDFLIPPVGCQCLVQRQHTRLSGDKRAPNTFRLAAQTEWRSKRRTHANMHMILESKTLRPN